MQRHSRVPQAQSTMRASPAVEPRGSGDHLAVGIRVGFQGEASLDPRPEDGHSGYYLAGHLGKLVTTGESFM